MSAAYADTIRHYKRAPIARATLEFVIERIDETMAPDLIKRVLAELNDSYPSKPEAPEVPEEFTKASTLKSLENVRSSSSGLELIEPREDGFSFTRLAPYETWELFSAEARRTWDIYARVFGNPVLQQFSVRYTNELRIPYNIPLHRFLNVYPHTPQPDVLFNNLIMFYEVSTEVPPGRLQVMLFPGPRDSEDKSTFPMFLANVFLFEVTNPASLWESLPAIRKLKNDTFNSQITDALKETIT